jgi:hypothetical protein
MLYAMKSLSKNHPIKRALCVRFFLLCAGIILQIFPSLEIRALGITAVIAAALSAALLMVDLYKTHVSLLIIFLTQGLSIGILVFWNLSNPDSPLSESLKIGLVIFGIAMLFLLDRFSSVKKARHLKQHNP